jgi:hypothetical protein
MRLCLIALLLSGPVLACSCERFATPCSAIGPSTVVFVGRVLVDSGKGWGTGPARVAIEEPLVRIPESLREVEIDTGARTSCHLHLEGGKRYVVFANWQDDAHTRLVADACGYTFLIDRNEYLLDALRNMAHGGPARLLGSVLHSVGYRTSDGVAGAKVVARSSQARYEMRMQRSSMW